MKAAESLVRVLYREATRVQKIGHADLAGELRAGAADVAKLNATLEQAAAIEDPAPAEEPESLQPPPDDPDG